jgi:hypothetical protein
MLEEGSWVVCAWLLLAPCAALLCVRVRKLRTQLHLTEPLRLPATRTARNVSTLLALCCVGYCPWGVVSDVPANYRRWRSEVADGSHFRSVGHGLAVVAGHCVPTQEYSVWSGYLLWMTGYFSLLVWASLALAISYPGVHDALGAALLGGTQPHVQRRVG